MGSRKDILKNLGIPEYPWSSDDEEPPSDPRPPPNTQTRSSGQQATSSSCSGNQRFPTRFPVQSVQASDLLLSLYSTTRRNATAGNSISERPNYRTHSDIPVPHLSRAKHMPVPELRERPTERADLEIQRVLAFKRLTRDVNVGQKYSRYAVARGYPQPGSVVPSENNSSSLRLPYYRRVYRNPSTNVTGSARQTLEAEEPVPSTSRSVPLPPLPASSEPPLELDNEPQTQVSSNDTSGSSVALEEEIVEIVDEPTTVDMNLIDVTRAVIPSSSDPNLASTSRPDEVDAAETEQLNHGVKRKRHDSADDQPAEQFTVKEFNQSLLRLLECPVCLEMMEPPMSQCRRGHLVCNRCRVRLASCPVCRTTFSSVRNRAMEGVAEMLRYPCRHGCGREVRLRKRSPHESSCAARKYHCPAPLCADRLPLPRDQLADHFHSKHSHLVKLGVRHHFGIKVNSEAHENCIIMALDEFFHMKMDVDIRIWGITVYVVYIGPRCNAGDFAYEVSIAGQHNGRKMTYKRATYSDLESSTLNVSRQDCFHLTLDQALNFIRFKNRKCDAEKYLEFEVEISRIDPPPSRDDSDS